MKTVRNEIYYHLQRGPMWSIGDVRFVGLQTNNYYSYFADNAHNYEDPITHRIIPTLELVLYLEEYIKTGIKNENNKYSYDILSSIKCIRNTLFNYSRFLREYLFEEVRSRSFSDYPSRQKGMSVISKKNDIQYWIKTLGISIESGTLLELSLTGRLHEASHKDIKLNTNSFNGIRRQAYNYWLTDKVEEDPFVGNECIFEGTAIVCNRIMVKDFLSRTNHESFLEDENIKFLSKKMDVDQLRKIILDEQPIRDTYGFSHGQRVANNCNLLATPGANRVVMYLFAFLHDTFRNEGESKIEYGVQSSEKLKGMRKVLLKNISDNEFDLLQETFRAHSAKMRTGNPTIDTCLDANRLDVIRRGADIYVDSQQMATERGKYFSENISEFIKISGNDYKKIY